ncbi:MAG: 16S rRNA (cytosine(1402)-N(4))-methyltransferase RsmH [Deltaproteobacteria bacterium]|nr:16S rRNA (cytosine(1402)-N(4))-methyltransferase RsmH [Deltaproteobacteria bacterium]
MVREVLGFLPLHGGGIIVDGTLGTGGHSLAILQHSPAPARLIGFDRDPESLEFARQRLQPFSDRITLAQGEFGEITAVLAGLGVSTVDFILLDLGFSSFQLASPGRGFSFQRLDPLDLRMNRREGAPLKDWLARAGETEIAGVLREYGEERWAGRISRALIQARTEGRLNDTQDLVQAVYRAVPPRFLEKRLHPATRTFQALRILINDELRQLERFLEQFLELLTIGGRVCLIAYHSLEDRLIKRAFRNLEQGRAPFDDSLPGPLAVEPAGPKVFRRLVKKPVLPGAEEVLLNPRARAAKLRVGQRLGTG